MYEILWNGNEFRLPKADRAGSPTSCPYIDAIDRPALRKGSPPFRLVYFY